MSVSDGQKVNAAVTNAAFMSRTVDTSTIGKIDLNEASSGSITDLQLVLNKLISDTKLFVKTADNSSLGLSAGSLSFTADIQVIDKVSGVVNSIAAASSPIAIADGESLYVTLDRTTTGVVTHTVADPIPQDVDNFRLATRIGNDLFWFNNETQLDGNNITLGSTLVPLKQETATGTVDGVNADFDISTTPQSGTSVVPLLNGIPQRLTTDYTLSGTTITFLTPPPSGSNVYVLYF